MTVLLHELKRGKTAFIIWTAAISFLLSAAVLLYPEMKEEMLKATDMFTSMGGFTDAFGLDRIDFGTLLGYYSIECGNVLGLGGALFAALTAVSSLSKEEKDRTAEFLFSHPVKRTRIISEKLLSVILQICAMNLTVFAVAVISVAATGESVPFKEMTAIHLSYVLMMIEIGCVCFGISAFAIKGSAGIGLGVALLAYLLNILSNLTKQAEILKYLTPFSYCDGAYIVAEGHPEYKYVAFGLVFCAAGIAAGYFKYTKKDLR